VTRALSHLEQRVTVTPSRVPNIASVSLEDTGAAAGVAGVAGQNIYNHFSTKHEILATAVKRGTERWWLDLAEVLASGQDNVDSLRPLVLRYTQGAPPREFRLPPPGPAHLRPSGWVSPSRSAGRPSRPCGARRSPPRWTGRSPRAYGRPGRDRSVT
jgi:hypothetical protein